LTQLVCDGRVTQVWCARADDGSACIVKLPAPALAGDRGAARLIEREWEFLGRAAQAGVVRALDTFEADTGPALVTEFLAGGSLVALAGSPANRWAGAVVEIADVVAELHRRGIVHRDLKPANVLFDGRDRATVIDFALAGSIGSPCPIGGGTSAYRRQPPSRADDAAEPGDDVYALAVMIFELMCGGLPFGQASAAQASDSVRRTMLARLEDAGGQTAAEAVGEAVRGVLMRTPADPAAALADLRSGLHAIITAH
jgi:serine/threonine protein kinase